MMYNTPMSQHERHKHLFFVAMLAFIVIFVPTLHVAAFANMPFGGMVKSIEPCDDGLLLYVRTFKGLLPFKWEYGQLPYMMHIPPHPGQNLLGMGMSSYIMSPCFVGPEYIGQGFQILYHGSSI